MLANIVKFLGEQYNQLKCTYFPGVLESADTDLYSKQVSILFEKYKREKELCTNSVEAKQLYEDLRRELGSLNLQFGLRNSTD